MDAPQSPLQRTSLRDQLSQRLEQMILRHDVAAGDRLPSERDLVERWRVSRAVVRNAIRTLESKGLVEVRQGVGAVVQGDVREAFARSLELLIQRGNYSLSEMMYLRTALELEAARLAAQRATEEDLQCMDTALNEFETAVRAGDIERVIEADRAFHLHLIAAAHNDPLMDLIAPIVRSFLTRTIILTPLKWDDTRLQNVQEHRRILDGVRARDPEEAARWMRMTLDRSNIHHGGAGANAGDQNPPEEYNRL